MLAAGYNWTWPLTAIGILMILWIAVRIWLNRGASAKTRELRQRLTDGSLSPRSHHYYFAHGALRSIAFEDPDRFIVAMAAPEAEDFLRRVWEDVGETIRKQEADAENVPPDGLEAIPARIAGRPVALIKMPPPRAATEAHFVAVILNHDIDEPARAAPQPPVYFFTLEKGFTLDGADRTVFCEWTPEAHMNYGDGPPAEARAFLNHIAAHLSGLDSTPEQPSREGKDEA